MTPSAQGRIVFVMPRVIVIGGPNGAGKTTFASAYLSLDREAAHFVNADEFYKEIVDEWEIWDSLEGDFRRVATWDD
jgi:cytidylate kinase